MLGGRLSASIGYVGIDVGTRAIKMLQLREHERGVRAVGAGRIELSADVGPDDPAALTDQFRAAFASGGFTGRRCVVSLPRHDIRLQSVRLPRMPEEELRQAAVWEAAERFGLDRASMEVDLIRTGAELQGSENREEVLLIAAPHERLAAWLEPMMAAGLRPAAVETHFTALARAFSRASPKRRVRALVDVGAAGSTAMILRDDQIALCKPITVGGRHFDEAVADHLQMEIDEAHDLRAGRIAGRAGVAPISDPSIERAEFAAVRPLLGAFAKEVMLCLRYYGVTFRGQAPEVLLLTGGDALEPRLTETLAAECKIPVALEEEGWALSGLAAQIEGTLHHAAGPDAWWAGAAGLSLRGLSASRLRRMQGVPVGEAA